MIPRIRLRAIGRKIAEVSCRAVIPYSAACPDQEEPAQPDSAPAPLPWQSPPRDPVTGRFVKRSEK